MRVKIPLVVLGPDGRPLAGATFAVRSRVDGSARTVFAAETGGAVLAGAALVSDAQGRVPGYTDRGRLEATITPPAGVPLAAWIESWDAAPAGDNDIDALWLPDNVVAQRHLGDDVVGAAELADRAVVAGHLALSILDLWGQTMLQEGVLNASGIWTRLSSTSMRIGAGEAWIDGDNVGGLQGRYRVTWPQTDLPSPIAAAPAGQARLDQVLVQPPAGGHGVGQVIRRQGTPAAGVTIANRNGAQPDAGGELLLGDLLVEPAGIAVLSATNSRDRRRWARGAHRTLLRTSGNVAQNATGPIVGILVSPPRLEVSGQPVRMKLKCRVVQGGGAAAVIKFYPLIDGLPIDGMAAGSSPLSMSVDLAKEYTADLDWTTATPPAAGSHLFSWGITLSAGTVTLDATAAVPLEVGFEEIRASQDNGV